MVYQVVENFVFAGSDHYEALGLTSPNVSDPIKDKKGGTLTLHNIYDAFSGTASSYSLVVDGKSWTVSAKKVDGGNLSFNLPKMTSGDKVGTVYELDAKGSRGDGFDVYFDVDDITEPAVSGKLAVTQNGNAFDLAWTSAKDDSPYVWSLTVKDGKNVVWQDNNIDGGVTGLSIDLAEMEGVTGKKLSFELYAHQEIFEHGEPVTLSSKKLSASATIKDKEAPGVTVPGRIFSDYESAELAGLVDYWFVTDPIKDKKGGTLTLYDVRDAFADNVGVTSYELVVDGKTYKCSKVNGDGGAEFKLPKMSSGFKTGTVRALDAAGNRSEAVEVRFDVDDITEPAVSGKLAVTQNGNAFDLAWTPAKDDSPYVWSLTVKDGKNVVWQDNNIDGGVTGLSIDLAEMEGVTGKKLSFELYAHQEIFEHGEPVTLSSKKLSTSAAIKDMEAPQVLSDKIFSDADHALWEGLDYDEYWFVGDPIHGGKGDLTLYDVDEAFADNVGIATYELVVDGKTFKTAAAKMADFGSVTFALSGISNGDKQGAVFAVDAAGNRSAGIDVFFDSDDKKY